MLFRSIFEIETSPKLFTSDEILGKAEISYQLTDTTDAVKTQYICLNNYQTFEKLDSSYLFLASVAELGMMLRNSKHVNNATWDDLEEQVVKSAKKNDFWQQELIQIVQQASNIYQVGKKKKKSRHKKKSIQP